MIVQRFQYAAKSVFPGSRMGLPFMSIALSNDSYAVTVRALLDSGSTVSVLPYDIGLELGLDWERQTVPTPLVGMLKDAPAWGVLITGHVEPFPPMPLLFAWTQVTSDRVPVILGQTNFFHTFDVCFSGSLQVFEIAPKETFIQPIKNSQ